MTSEPSSGARFARVPEWRNQVTFFVGTVTALVGFEVGDGGSPAGYLIIPVIAAVFGGIQLLIVKVLGLILLVPLLCRWWNRSAKPAVTLFFVGAGCWLLRFWIDAELLEQLSKAGMGFLDNIGLVGGVTMLFVLCHWPRTSKASEAEEQL